MGVNQILLEAYMQMNNFIEKALLPCRNNLYLIRSK